MKPCFKCKCNLSFEFFSKNKTTKDGFQSKCKKCTSEFYAANKESILAKVINYQATRKEEKRGYDKARRELLGDKLRESDRIRNKLPHRKQKSLDWQKNNVEKTRLIKNKSARKNWHKTYERSKHSYVAAAGKRRATILGNKPSDFDNFVFKEAIHLAKLREKSTKFKWDIDHIVPLSKNGKHSFDNFQVVPRFWNRSKGNKNCNFWGMYNQRKSITTLRDTMLNLS